jgi:hypothetical protein
VGKIRKDRRCPENAISCLEFLIERACARPVERLSDPAPPGDCLVHQGITSSTRGLPRLLMCADFSPKTKDSFGSAAGHGSGRTQGPLSALPSPSPWGPPRSAIHTRSSHSKYAGADRRLWVKLRPPYCSASVSFRSYSGPLGASSLELWPIFAITSCRIKPSNSMLGLRPTTPQDYLEWSGFGGQREREWGHRRQRAAG